jgi:hypothetical protein
MVGKWMDRMGLCFGVADTLDVGFVMFWMFCELSYDTTTRSNVMRSSARKIIGYDIYI